MLFDNHNYSLSKYVLQSVVFQHDDIYYLYGVAR